MNGRSYTGLPIGCSGVWESHVLDYQSGQLPEHPLEFGNFPHSPVRPALSHLTDLPDSSRFAKSLRHNSVEYEAVDELLTFMTARPIQYYTLLQSYYPYVQLEDENKESYGRLTVK
eukprot:6179652-Pleurochrysis_carterae.AAC.1